MASSKGSQLLLEPREKRQGEQREYLMCKVDSGS